MQVSLSILHHPKDGYAIDLNRLINVNKVFIKRDTDHWDRDFCVYVFEDENGVERYYGKGRWWDLTHKKWYKSRPFTHKNDMLSSAINENWTCRIIAIGLTDIESKILEAYCIYQATRYNKLSKSGTKKWDRCSLINKRRERKWEKWVTEYLDLGNGNNTRIAA